jgi:FAD:protein FMN transferase
MGNAFKTPAEPGADDALVFGIRELLVMLKPSSIALTCERGQPAMRFALILLMLMAPHAAAETMVLRGAAQGTTYHIKLVVPAGRVDAQQLHAAIEKQLAEIDRQMSTYRADSEISQFNRAPAGEWFDVSPAVARVVEAARAISEKTDGAMDVTVGPLVRLWHFGPPSSKATSSNPPPKGEGLSQQKFRPPSDAEISAALKCVGYRKLEVRMTPSALRKQVDGLEVDLSSIASGYTIDRLAELLADHGIKNFVVELGGEIRAAGSREDGAPWRVAIERPIVEKQEMEVAVSLVNTSLATAGGTHKFFEYGGRRYSHIIDPATGRPVEHTLASVTVAAETCIEADGWDTPLLVLGPERGVKCAEENGMAAMFISHPDAGDGADAVRTTSAWQKRFGEDGNSRRTGKASSTR